jgi:tetratricopeptide (TPR) repeat protein
LTGFIPDRLPTSHAIHIEILLEIITMKMQQFVRVGFSSLTIALMLGAPIAQSASASTIAQVPQSAPAATGDDKSTQAMQAFEAGDKLYDKGDADSLRKAVVLFETAAKLSKEAKDEKVLALSLIAVGGSQFKLNNDMKALEAFEAVIPLLPKIEIAAATKQQLLEGMSGLYLKRSTALVEKSPDQALLDAQKALAIFRSTKAKQGEAVALLMTGRIYLELKQNQAAIDAMTQALPIFQSLKDRDTEGTTLLGIASAQLQLGEIPASLALLKQAEQAFRDSKNMDSLKTVQELIQKITNASSSPKSTR